MTKQDSLIVNYRNTSNRDTMSVSITEITTDTLRRFSESYTIPIFISDYSTDTIRYIEHFVYIDKIGLFRKINSIAINSIDEILGHFIDFLWIPDYILKGDSDTLITYSDNSFYPRTYVEIQEPLIEYKIWFLKKEYNDTLKDSLVTLVFEQNINSGITEMKSYDSFFNLVNYSYIQNNPYRINEFTIIPKDYKKLSNFRKKYRKIFDE